MKLTRAFFERNTLEVARALLGKVLLVREEDGVTTASRIVETEAYRGRDPASHSAAGRTPRASIMFGPAARAYVYFCYGMHEMLNFVTEPEEKAGAVLIRAIEPLSGRERLLARRAVKNARDLTNGPAKLCKALGIRMSDNGSSLLSGRFTVADDGFRPHGIARSPRVGISSGTEKYWRFFIEGHRYVSRAPENKLARPV